MALRDKSLFLYGFEVTSTNFAIDFKKTSGGAQLMASLRFGFYSLTDLLIEIKRALEAADPSNTYTATANRSISSGTQNRVTISTSGSYLELDFLSGPRSLSSIHTMIGFPSVNQTGATTYTGTSSAGTVLLTTLTGYTFLPPELLKTIIGTINITTDGQKEALVWSVQKFTQIEFKYEPEAKSKTEWANFLTWATQQRPFDFTPEAGTYGTVHNVTLETTSADGKGLGYRMDEMLPDFPFNYKTGILKMRVKE